MSQSDMILDALLRGETLTPLEALKLYGCLRLGARIWDLRQQGHNIIMEMVTTMNGKHVAQYSMPAKKGQLRLAV